jgi:membrane protease YdiL (CAAX protease family)
MHETVRWEDRQKRTRDDVSQDPPTDGPDHDHDHDHDDDGTDNEWGMGPIPFALLVLFELALAPASLVLGKIFGQEALAGFQWDLQAALVGVLASLPMLGLLVLILRWPIGPLARIKEYFERELAPALHGCKWPDLALLSVSAGVGEEMLFRGVIQGFLGRLLGRWPGLVLASLLFGLLHPVSLGYVAVAALLGAYLGAVWLVSGNLLTVMVAHAVYDLVALGVLVRTRPPDHDGDDA